MLPGLNSGMGTFIPIAPRKKPVKFFQIAIMGESLLFDPPDVQLVKRYTWSLVYTGNTAYAKANVHGTTSYLHRLIVFGFEQVPSVLEVDHVNGNGLDNRRENLRVVEHGQNMQNAVGRPAIRRSAYKGVCWRKDATKPFRACIHMNGKQIHLGYYSSEIEAARAYDAAALHHFGEYARLNFGVADLQSRGGAQ